MIRDTVAIDVSVQNLGLESQTAHWPARVHVNDLNAIFHVSDHNIRWTFVILFDNALLLLQKKEL